MSGNYIKADIMSYHFVYFVTEMQHSQYLELYFN